MAMTDSFLTRAIADFRRYTDEPSVSAKYTDTILIEMIEQSYAHVISEINRNRIEPIVARYTVTYVAGTSIYLLPSLIGSIHAIYQYLSTGGIKIFYSSRSKYNPYGRRMWIEGFTLHIQAGFLSAGDEVIIEYVPSGTARLHNGTCTVDSTGKIVTLGDTPSTGAIDTHTNSYAGSVFRIVSDTDTDYNYIQERNILSYANTTLKATLDLALSPNAGDGVQSGTTSYEIAPAIHRGLDHVVALYLAYWIAAVEGTVTRARLIEKIYRGALRNARLNAYYSNLVEASTVRADNFDNPRYGHNLLIV